MEFIEGGITSPKGFSAASCAAGIKYQNRDDMALILSEGPCTCAGTFTTNVVKAAPVIWDRDIVKKRSVARAILVNAGIANACTGQQGLDVCQEEAKYVAQRLNILPSDVFVASTGVIGKQLPMDKIKAGVDMMAPKLAETREAGIAAAEAIMTTDTKRKEIAIQVEIGGAVVTIAGMCKGSGMIHPNMCTMLSFITTDVSIDQKLLQQALSACVDETYNMISVDGDTSTNDTCIVMANGLAGNPRISREGQHLDLFVEALYNVNLQLAKMMAADGEGATALFEVTVEHCPTVESARILAKSVITSSLTKAAIFGHDANWGRILCALGYSGVEFDPSVVDLKFVSANGEIDIMKDGNGLDFDEELATKILSAPEVCAIADMHAGKYKATAYGCDLTYDYVKINADYRS